MKDLFFNLLRLSNEYGNITEAKMYDGEFSTITFVDGNKEYSVSIRVSEVENED